MSEFKVQLYQYCLSVTRFATAAVAVQVEVEQ